MISKKIQIENSNVLILGLTFKENCPDLRNTKVVDIISELKEYNINVDVFDPWCSSEEAEREYNIPLIPVIKKSHYDSIIIAVGHNKFKELGSEIIHSFGKNTHILYDLKYILPKEEVDIRL